MLIELFYVYLLHQLITTNLFNIMLKLSENNIRKFSYIAVHFGDEIGLVPHLPAGALLYWSDAQTFCVSDTIEPTTFGYCLFYYDNRFYFVVGTSIISFPKHYVIPNGGLGFSEAACMCYLIFVKHKTLDYDV